jgi:hypothetical protein
MSTHDLNLRWTLLLTLLLPGWAMADLTGVWEVTSSYTWPNGVKGSSTGIVDMIQTENKLTAIQRMTSENDRIGEKTGYYFPAATGNGVISEPYNLVQLVRKDPGTQYMALSIGIVSRDNQFIQGYFVDINGAEGTFTMKRADSTLNGDKWNFQ